LAGYAHLGGLQAFSRRPATPEAGPPTRPACGLRLQPRVVAQHRRAIRRVGFGRPARP